MRHGEILVSPDEFIVSKTDATGKITYVNHVFERVTGFLFHEVQGKAHSIIRHPDMPRAVFGYLWREIQAGREVFAFVVNRTKNEGFYWVFAHVTPTFAADGTLRGYHSNRRAPNRAALPEIEALYAALREEEAKHPRAQAVAASMALLERTLAERGTDYPRFMFELERRGAAS